MIDPTEELLPLIGMAGGGAYRISDQIGDLRASLDDIALLMGHSKTNVYHAAWERLIQGD